MQEEVIIVSQKGVQLVPNENETAVDSVFVHFIGEFKSFSLNFGNLVFHFLFVFRGQFRFELHSDKLLTMTMIDYRYIYYENIQKKYSSL